MKKKKEKNKIIYYILFGIIIFCIIYIIDSNNLLKIGKNSKKNNSQASRISMQETIESQQENINIEENKEQVEQVEQIEEKVDETNTIQESTIQEQQDKGEENQIPSKMAGYEVLGRLVIEKVNIRKNILNVSTKNSLKVSAVKLYGPNINEIGNFCICGHNWKSMLKRALELEIGDTFYLIDKETLNKVNYEIYDIYTCMPKDLECLKQNTDGKREATIITCNTGGITRLIIKAKEKCVNDAIVN